MINAEFRELCLLSNSSCELAAQHLTGCIEGDTDLMWAAKTPSSSSGLSGAAAAAAWYMAVTSATRPARPYTSRSVCSTCSSHGASFRTSSHSCTWMHARIRCTFSRCTTATNQVQCDDVLMGDCWRPKHVASERL